jgi:hypothetical protein
MNVSPLVLCQSRLTVMQPKVLCLFGEVGCGSRVVIPCSFGGGNGCLFIAEFSFVLD